MVELRADLTQLDAQPAARPYICRVPTCSTTRARPMSHGIQAASVMPFQTLAPADAPSCKIIFVTSPTGARGARLICSSCGVP